MNIQNLKQATTGMLADRPIKMRYGNDVSIITAFNLDKTVIELTTNTHASGLTLGDLWELPEEKQLVGRTNGTVFPIFGYRVDEDAIILG